MLKEATRLSNKLTQPLKNQRGVALMVALFAMIFMLFLATQISYETQVNYTSSAHGLRKLKAFYAAKAGADLALFRVALYQKVRASLDSQIGSNPQLQYMVDQIWKFPFSWPPVLPDDSSSFTQSDIKDNLEESFMDSQYTVTIQAEGGRIDVNDFGSPVEALGKTVRDSLLQIFTNQVEGNDDFKEKYDGYDFNELVNNIHDWVDADSDGRNNSSESQDYDSPDDANVQLPPNRAFRTIDELRMVAGMNDDFFELIKDKVTVYGTKGINPNEATRKVLMSLDPEMTEEIITEVIKRRTDQDLGGPFRDDNDFFSFLQGEGLDTDELEEKKIPFYYNAAYNFRIISTGKSSNMRREIIAITFDFENLSRIYKKQLDDQCEADGKCKKADTGSGNTAADPGSSGNNNTNTDPNSNKYIAPKGRPVVVYWEES